MNQPQTREHLRRLGPIRHLMIVGAFALAAAASRADDWAPNLTLTGAWNTNATNADRSADKIGAVETTADVLANKSYRVTTADEALPGVHLSGDWWPRYQLLSAIALGARGEWRHTFGTGALAPIASVELGGDYVAAKETGRRGMAYGVTFALRKKITDVARVTLSEELSRLDARYSVYDSSASRTTIALERDVTDVARVKLAAFWRDGTVTSYATALRPEIATVAKHTLTVDTFRHPLTAYAYNGETLGGNISVVRALSESSALIVAYEYRHTEHSPVSFANHVGSIAIVHQY